MADTANITSNVVSGVVTTTNISSTTITGAVTTGGVGPAGANGTNGTNGTNGQGVPTGGTTNQVLSKIDATDYHTQWVTPASATGATKAFAIAMATAL